MEGSKATQTLIKFCPCDPSLRRISSEDFERCASRKPDARCRLSAHHSFRSEGKSLNLWQSRRGSRLSPLPSSGGTVAAQRYASTLATHRGCWRRDRAKGRSRSGTTPPPRHGGSKISRQARQHGNLRTHASQLGNVRLALRKLVGAPPLKSQSTTKARVPHPSQSHREG
jgi:hypothetical protein